jgi:hypothetical protein
MHREATRLVGPYPARVRGESGRQPVLRQRLLGETGAVQRFGIKRASHMRAGMGVHGGLAPMNSCVKLPREEPQNDPQERKFRGKSVPCLGLGQQSRSLLKASTRQINQPVASRSIGTSSPHAAHSDRCVSSVAASPGSRNPNT